VRSGSRATAGSSRAVHGIDVWRPVTGKLRTTTHDTVGGSRLPTLPCGSQESEYSQDR
jgi:hypothetical protein